MRPLIAISLITTMFLGIACLAYAVECAPTEAIEAYESGKALLESGRFDEGITELERAVAFYPDFDDAWFDLYEEYNRANRVDDVIIALEQLIRIQPGAEIWRGLLALHLADVGIPPAALEALNRCRSLKPGSKRAIAACEQALSLHANYVDAHYFLGVNYIYARKEDLAKKALSALIALDPTMAGMLVHVMDELTNWVTEDYKQELETVFAAAHAKGEPDAAAETPPAEFSDQDVARILGAYEKQIEALQKLIADPGLRPEACEGQAPQEIRNQLMERLMPLSFVRVEMPHKPDCYGLGYLLLDVRDPADRQRGLSEVVKISKNLGIGDPERERWRVGLHEEWVAEKYCKEECRAMLEFRIDRETGDQPVKFKAWVGIQEEISDIAQCSSYYGENPSAEDW